LRSLAQASQLRKFRLPAQRADGVDAAHHPLGNGRIKRHAPALRPVFKVRAHGRNFAAPEFGWKRCRLDAVPARHIVVSDEAGARDIAAYG